MYGGSPSKEVAITFDDGPDPEWTPKILDVLKRRRRAGTFFLIGVRGGKISAASRSASIDEGHEIGNHTFTHPDISNISKRYFEVELNLTERLFDSKLGVKPVLFRPPYSIDQEPDTADQVRPLEVAQDMGYITIGDKIDPNDWRDNPHRSAEEITADVSCQTCRPARATISCCGNIILLHDGGGDRSETVSALPMIIEGLRARGYEIVPVSQLMGKTRADVMPPICPQRALGAHGSTAIGFWLLGCRHAVIIWVISSWATC